MPPSAADLRTKAVALREASAEISSGISSTSSIHSQLGDQVAVHGKKRGLKKGQSARDIFQSWDKNGNAHLSKMEFRVAARKLHLDAATDSSTVDSLFAELDKDGDGNLNTSDSEFKEALEMLKDESAAAEAEREDAKAEALRLLDVANQCIKTAGALEAVDAAKAEMTRLEQLVGASVQRRVGMALLGMGFRAVDIALKWDSNKDGRVDKDEVMAGLKALNVSASDEDLQRFFDSMDRDGDGTIDQTEAKKAFRAFNVDKAAYETRRSDLKMVLDEKREAAQAERQTLHEMEVAAGKAARVKKTKPRSGKPKTKGGKSKAKNSDSKREAAEVVTAEAAAEPQATLPDKKIDKKSVAFTFEPQAAVEPQQSLMEC